MIKISKQGALSGYTTGDLARNRRNILDKYLKLNGYSAVIKRLNAIAILNKNRNPFVSETIRKDIKYIQSHYSHLKKSPTKKSQKSVSRKSRSRKSRKSVSRKSRK